MYGLSDTMDVMAHVIMKQDALIRKQDARMTMIEEALIDSGKIQAEDLQ